MVHSRFMRLNPYSNGMKIEQEAIQMKKRLEAVLILILME